MDTFYNLTNYNITFVIDTNENVYSVDWVLFTLLVTVSAISILAGVGLIISKKKQVTFIEEEIKNGNAKKYFEGEDTFEEYCKEHPLDDEIDPFEKYDSNKDPFEEYSQNDFNK